MNFKTFAVGSTNVFPASNTINGGQLLTEFNLRARESIATPEEIQYFIGPSYVHSERDFLVTIQTDEIGTEVSCTRLRIAKGRGLINGHYVETLAPMEIDLAEANAYINEHNASVQSGELKLDELDLLNGELTIGIRIMYSGETSMAGSILPENDKDIYEGIQIVVLPKSKFKLPEDVPYENGIHEITAHIKLADLSFRNGAITGVINNYPAKCFCLPASRIKDIESALSGNYISGAGLDPDHFYVFAGRGTSLDKNGKPVSSWHKGTGSLMVWDNNPSDALSAAEQKSTYIPKSAEFVSDTEDDSVALVIPHASVNNGSTRVVRRPVSISIPNADYRKGTPGVVSTQFINKLKDVEKHVSDVYTLTNGKQVMYLDELNTTDDLPQISREWGTGDYILVREDKTVSNDLDATFPTTMYVCIPGKVKQIEIDESTSSAFDANTRLVEMRQAADAAKLALDAALDARHVAADAVVEAQANVDELLYTQINLYDKVDKAKAIEQDTATTLTKAEAALQEAKDNNEDTAAENAAVNAARTANDNAKKLLSEAETNLSNYKENIGAAITALSSAITALTAASSDVESYQVAYAEAYNSYIGAVEVASQYEGKLMMRSIVDSVEIKRIETNDSSLDPTNIVAVTDLFDIKVNNEYQYTGSIGDYFTLVHTKSGKTRYYYYRVCGADPLHYSDPIYLTRQIPFASTHQVGGFYNVTEDMIDDGYIILDEDGHLRLLDYALLRSSMLAYQLGEDQAHQTGIDNKAINEWLNENVNQRIAFPNLNHLTHISESGNGDPNVIEVTINLNANDASNETIEVFDIDSRFNTAVYLKIIGEAPSTGAVINISDCQKIRIDSNIPNNVTVNLYRSCVYYDAAVLDRLNIVQDMSLWYFKYDDTQPELIVDRMTVRVVEPPVYVDEIDYWNSSNKNDNHYKYALQSLTFGSDASILGCSIYIKNDSTANVDEGMSVVIANFTLPESSSLTYPKSKLRNSLKVTGSFVTAYKSKSAGSANSADFDLYVIMKTSFTAMSQYFNERTLKEVPGQISVLTDTKYLPLTSVTMLFSGESEYADEHHPWENSFHIFDGGVLGIGNAAKA